MDKSYVEVKVNYRIEKGSIGDESGRKYSGTRGSGMASKKTSEPFIFERE